MKHINVSQRVIIVAGGTGGIGSAVCRLLAEEGTIVIAASRTAERSSPVQNCASTSQHMLVDADLSSSDAWDSLVQRVVSEYHRVDVLIHCAGALVQGAIHELAEADIQRTVATNIMSMIHGVRAVLPRMRQQGCGHIITVGSLGGIMPMPHETLYGMTKAAVRAFTLALDKELHGTGIRLSVVSPGPVRTPMLDREARDDRSTMAFIQRPLPPEQVARVILRTLQRPRREVLLPPLTGRLAQLVAQQASVFSLCYPFLNTVGRLGLKRYRRHIGMYPMTPTVEG